MESKINVVKRDLRGLKKSSRAVKRLLEIQGLHYKRINALSHMEQTKEIVEATKKEKELLSALNITEELCKAQDVEKKYSTALSSLSTEDKAMVLDCYINGLPYWKIGMEYGFSEAGARKHIDTLVKKLSTLI